MHSQRFKHVSASNEGDYDMVAFGDAEDGSQDYVILQLSSEFDGQDRDCGMDGIYLEINDQAHCGYKLVHRIEVAGNAVTIHFSAMKLGLPDAYSPFQMMFADAAPLASEVTKALATMANRMGIDFQYKPT